MVVQQKAVYEFDAFRLDPAEHLLLRNGNTVALTPKVFETLVILVQNRAHVLSKENLLKTLWPDSFVTENTLNRNISTLRKALGESPEDHKYIQTIPKIGFRFVANVTELPNASLAPTSDASSVAEPKPYGEQESNLPHTVTDPRPPANGFPRVAGEKRESGRANPLRVRLLLASLAALSVVAIAFYLLNGRAGSEAIDSIAVLPFVNVGGDPGTEYMADGITENLINSLAQAPNFKVISRASVFRYKGKETDPVLAGRELNVAAVLTGRVIHRGDLVSIHIELVKVADETQIWGQNFTRKLGDVLALEEEISRVTADQLHLELTGEERQRLSRRYTQSTAAYQLYLKGLYFRNKHTEEGMRKGIEYFEQAVEQDPNYGLAYAGMAHSYNWISRNGRQASDEIHPIAEAMGMKAVELDETLGEAHMALADVRYTNWDWSGLEVEFQRAIKLSPNNSQVHALYSGYLTALGRFEEAIAEARQAQELDPLAVGLNPLLGINLYMARQFDQSMQELQQLLDLDGNLISARQHLGEVYAAKGMYPEALEQYRRAAATLGISIDDAAAEPQKAATFSGDGIAVLARIARIYALSGEKTTARNLLDRLEGLLEQTYVSRFLIARIYIGLGEYDQAFAWLEEAYNLHESGLILLGVSPIYDPLRTDPRFQDLQRRIGLPNSPTQL